MNRLFVTGVAAVLLVGMVRAADPSAETTAVEQDIGELKLMVEELNRRVTALEKRVASLETDDHGLYPWQREQPFLWDSVRPVNRNGILQQRRRESRRHPY